MEEALGYTPTLSNFGSSRFGQYSKVLNDDINKAWTIFSSAIEAAKRALPPPEVTHRPLETRPNPVASASLSTIQPAAQANLEVISKLQKEAEQLSYRPVPAPTPQPAIKLDAEAISKLREESEHLQDRLFTESEEGQEQPSVSSAPAPVPVAPAVSVTSGPAPDVDEDWQIIHQQWQPEHWEIIRLLYQEQSA